MMIGLFPLVQGYEGLIVDTNENGDWSQHSKYCPVKTREFPLDNMHMIKANSSIETKITTLEMIKPDNKHNKIVVKSLEEWAAKILCWENDYVQDLANTDNETKLRFERTKTHEKKLYLKTKKLQTKPTAAWWQR